MTALMLDLLRMLLMLSPVIVLAVLLLRLYRRIRRRMLQDMTHSSDLQGRDEQLQRPRRTISVLRYIGEHVEGRA